MSFPSPQPSQLSISCILCLDLCLKHSVWWAHAVLYPPHPPPFVLRLQTGCEAESLYHIQPLHANVTGGRLNVSTGLDCRYRFGGSWSQMCCVSKSLSEPSIRPAPSLDSLLFSLLCYSAVCGVYYEDNGSKRGVFLAERKQWPKKNDKNWYKEVKGSPITNKLKWSWSWKNINIAQIRLIIKHVDTSNTCSVRYLVVMVQEYTCRQHIIGAVIPLQ